MSHRGIWTITKAGKKDRAAIYGGVHVYVLER